MKKIIIISLFFALIFSARAEAIIVGMGNSVVSAATPSVRHLYSTYVGNAQTGVAVVAGDLIIVGYVYNAALASITCSDNASGGTNTYSQVGTGYTETTSPTSAHVFYAIAKATETLTITCTSKTDNGLSVHVVANMNQTLASVKDTSGSTSESSLSSSHDSGNITTTNASDYIFVLWASEWGVRTWTENGTGFTKETEQSGHSHATFDRVVSGTGIYHDATTTNSSNYAVAIIAAFKGQ